MENNIKSNSDDEIIGSIIAAAKVSPAVVKPKPLDNNGWNPALEDLARSIGESAAELEWQHEFESSVLNFMSNVVGTLSLIFATLAFVTSGLLSVDEYKDLSYIYFINIVIAAVVTFFSGAKQLLPLNNLSAKHKNAAGRYQKLKQRIVLQLTLNSLSRISGNAFNTDISRELNILYSTSQSISLITKCIYKLVFRNGAEPLDIKVSRDLDYDNYVKKSYEDNLAEL